MKNAGDMPFTEALKQAAGPAWTAAVEHRFVRELAADTLEDPVYGAYLRQDYAFLGSLVSLVGAAVAHAPSMPVKARFAAFLGVLTGPENDYFERSFAALSFPLEDPEAITRGAVTDRFAGLMDRVIREGDYGTILTVLVGAEWSYLTWATEAARSSRPARFYLAEWIDLHADPGFADFVGWLCRQLDTAGATADPTTRDRLREVFRETMELEAAFYDQAYTLAGE